MTLRPGTSFAAAVLAVFALPAAAQPSAVNRAKVPAADVFRVGPGTKLADVLAKPDATQVVLADGKQTTVGEIRRSVGQRDQRLASLKTRIPSLPGRMSVRSQDAAAKLKILANTLAAEDAAAKAAHGAPPVARGPGVVGAIDPKNFEGILHVNKRERGWHVTPGGFLTIDGQGFGDAIGEVKIFGQFAGSPLVVNPIDWRNAQIYAQLPLGIRGIADQDVQIQVITAARKTHRLDGGHFVATRGEEFVVRDGIHRLIKFFPGGFSTAMGDDGKVLRLDHGDDIACFAPGGDRLRTVDPGRGFAVTGLYAHTGRTDSGEGDQWGMAGNRTFTPGYDFGDWRGDEITFSYGVWRSHTSPSFAGLVGSSDWCESTYQIEVTVQGPLGVPF